MKSIQRRLPTATGKLVNYGPAAAQVNVRWREQGIRNCESQCVVSLRYECQNASRTKRRNRYVKFYHVKLYINIFKTISNEGVVTAPDFFKKE